MDCVQGLAHLSYLKLPKKDLVGMTLCTQETFLSLVPGIEQNLEVVDTPFHPQHLPPPYTIRLSHVPLKLLS